MALRVTTISTGLDGAPWFTTMYFGGTTQADADEAVASVALFWDAIDQNISNAVTMAVQAEVEDVDTNTGQVVGIFVTAGATAQGQNSLDPLSSATQGLLRWRTGVFIGGREVRGRTFIPGPTEALNGLGNPIPAYLTTANLAAATLLGALSTGNELVIYSPTHAQSSVVQSGNTWNRWAVLRSRRD